MLDMFGRRIKVDDIVVYVTRSGSSTHTQVARALVVEERRVRVGVLAGNGYEWSHGRWRSAGHVPFMGYEAWLRASHNVMVANGIDAAGIRDKVLAQQQEHREARDRRAQGGK